LDENSRAVALQRVGPSRPAVREGSEDLQPLRDDIVAFRAFDVRNEPQAARVVLVGWIRGPAATGRIRERSRWSTWSSTLRPARPPSALGPQKGRTYGRRAKIFILARLLHRGN
jgi:hypothetical protein